MKKLVYIGAAVCIGLSAALILNSRAGNPSTFNNADRKYQSFIGDESSQEVPVGETRRRMALAPAFRSGKMKKWNPVEKQTAANALSAAEIQRMPAGTTLEKELLNKDMISGLFYETEISEEVYRRIDGISWQENEQIGLEELRYLRVLHWGFDEKPHIGELIVNIRIAADVLEIMEDLYEQKYPIEKMLLIDEYGGSDEASMEDNNTSAFNYRLIAGTSKLSNHSMGLALDINPRYNPYVKERDGTSVISPVNGADFADRSREFPYKIAGGDLCLRLFLEHGFTWGGNWGSVKDYQHFEKE